MWEIYKFGSVRGIELCVLKNSSSGWRGIICLLDMGQIGLATPANATKMSAKTGI